MSTLVCARVCVCVCVCVCAYVCVCGACVSMCCIYIRMLMYGGEYGAYLMHMRVFVVHNI